MDIITTIIYIVLFIIMMIFVFSIGMLKKYMPNREVILVLVVAFLIGSIGGAFFLDPIYDDLPNIVGAVEKNLPNNEETLYLNLSSSIDTTSLENELSSTKGFVSYNETSVSIPMWKFDKNEKDYFEYVVGNIDSHYKNYTVTSNQINIDFEDNYSSSQALKSFSDWYKLVYGGTISYAQIQAVLVVDSYAVDDFEQILLDKGVVASHVEGPVHDIVDNTNSSMLPNWQFTLICGGFGVVVAIFGIYMDEVIPACRRFKKFLKSKRK